MACKCVVHDHSIRVHFHLTGTFISFIVPNWTRKMNFGKGGERIVIAWPKRCHYCAQTLLSMGTNR